MRKHLPWMLALSIALNIYLTGSVLLSSSPVTGAIDDASNHHTAQDLAPPDKPLDHVQELQEQIKDLQQEKEKLQQELNKLRQANTAATTINTTDNKVHGWYFKRDDKNLPPTTEPEFIQMLKGKGHFIGDTSKKNIYLTFDEGYENGYTPQILDTLKKHKVPAAFFVTGSYVKKNPDLIKRMHAEGHIIGNHSDTHPSMPSISNEQIVKELNTVEKQVQEITKGKMHFFRPPRGEFNQRVLDVADQEGYSSIFWSMAYRDWLVDDQPGQEAAYNFVTKNIHNGAIILLHAVSKSNTDALDTIIKELKDRGYTFTSLQKLP